MGADNFVQATVVTPAGQIVVANEYQNSDLFWAIRGGGGGTWGVVTSVTVNAYPMPTALMWSLSAEPLNANTTDDSEWYDLLGNLFSELPSLKEFGLQGYITVTASPVGLTSALFAYDQSKESVEAKIEPLVQSLQSRNSTIKTSSKVLSFPKWIDVYHLFNLTQATAGGNGETSASRLLPAKALTDDLKDFTELVKRTLTVDPEVHFNLPLICGMTC
jgi:hypothetical protein